MKLSLKYPGLVLFAFLYIYMPPILLMNTMHFLAIIAYLLILLNKEYRFNDGRRYLQSLYLFLLVQSAYLFIVGILGTGSLMNAYDPLMYMLEGIPIAYVISKKTILGRCSFVNIVISAGVLQGCISILAFLIPSIQQVIINRMLSYGYREVVIFMAKVRMFGFSYTLPYAMPVAQSIICCLAIFLAINKSIKYIFCAGILAFSAIINARISIGIIGIGCFFIIFDKLRLGSGLKLRLIFAAVIFCISVNVLVGIVQKNSPKTYAWLTEATRDIANFFTDQDYEHTSYIAYATNLEKYQLPSGMALIIGTGMISTRGNELYKSDIGYINDIWLGGILYVTLTYVYVISRIRECFKIINRKKTISRIVLIGFFAMLAIANIKGRVLAFNEIMNLIYLIMIYLFTSDATKTSKTEDTHNGIEIYTSKGRSILR